mmetsp:Transcript_27849/g.69989  ORF Transcript_27849/g.69989 Transcript_27849/m.69989 type:complete len:217 (-) Transcript_27849:413-1063(-)
MGTPRARTTVARNSLKDFQSLFSSQLWRSTAHSLARSWNLTAESASRSVWRHCSDLARKPATKSSPGRPSSSNSPFGDSLVRRRGDWSPSSTSSGSAFAAAVSRGSSNRNALFTASVAARPSFDLINSSGFSKSSRSRSRSAPLPSAAAGRNRSSSSSRSMSIEGLLVTDGFNVSSGSVIAATYRRIASRCGSETFGVTAGRLSVFTCSDVASSEM